MLYYHIRIVYKPEKSEKLEETSEIDLSDNELVEFVRLYNQGQTFICGGRTVNPHRIHKIEIHKTQREARKIEQTYPLTTTWGFICDFGEVVTRQFIKKPPSKVETSKKEIRKPSLSRNVFIVHGRNHKPMKELKTILYDFGLNPIVLHEKASGGLTLAEKLEKYSEDVGYAFVILTPDDVGCLESKARKVKSELKKTISGKIDFN